MTTGISAQIVTHVSATKELIVNKSVEYTIMGKAGEACEHSCRFVGGAWFIVWAWVVKLDLFLSSSNSHPLESEISHMLRDILENLFYARIPGFQLLYTRDLLWRYEIINLFRVIVPFPLRSLP